MTTGAFFLYWLSFTLLILITGAFAAYWAFRAGHFKDQERARYLALWAEIPEQSRGKSPNAKIQMSNQTTKDNFKF